MPVILLGTLDTKGVEFEFVQKLLQDKGLQVLTIDAGTQTPHVAADIASAQVFEAAGTTLEAVQKANDRGQAVESAARGVVPIVQDLWKNGRVDGILSLGGSAGTTIG
ncbi:MAG: Tm-1-like ATP-binding domain-containing protein, partial [Gemmataceae bacterium]|nr:Tm-1-like ATP-binding domain-containing protein [Gemmataceae bacterium]